MHKKRKKTEYFNFTVGEVVKISNQEVKVNFMVFDGKQSALDFKQPIEKRFLEHSK